MGLSNRLIAKDTREEWMGSSLDPIIVLQVQSIHPIASSTHLAQSRDYSLGLRRGTNYGSLVVLRCDPRTRSSDTLRQAAAVTCKDGSQHVWLCSRRYLLTHKSGTTVLTTSKKMSPIESGDLGYVRAFEGNQEGPSRLKRGEVVVLLQDGDEEASSIVLVRKYSHTPI